VIEGVSTMQILYATDGQPPAVDAGRLLTSLVDPARAEVTILSAHDAWTEEVEDYFADVLGDAEKQMAQAGLVSSSMWRRGSPARCIERELRTHPYDVVVVGAGNHGWLGRWVMGSVSSHVLTHATTPVLVVHRAPDDDSRVRVLVGADGSPALERAIDTLASISSPGRIDVFVRAVAETPDLAFAARPGAAVSPSYVEDAFREARTLAAAHLEDGIGRIRAAGFRVEGSLGEGWPGNDLLELATDRRADLVVVGAHRAGVVERLVMGSVSAHVARHAPATLLAGTKADLLDEEPIEEPNGHVGRNRFPVRWA
jgi:nucleotide-binding universal stress UspA family protein